MTRMTVVTLASALCAMASGAAAQSATATLQPTAGNTTAGTVTFTAQGGQLAVHARVTGLKPNAEHGFHLHEKGDCSSPDATSAGGHFNPDGKPHGPQDAPHHAGDMPALKADGSGVAEARFMLAGVSVGSGPADVVGKGLIVHAQPDDYKTQPTGNAGARLACGVVKAQ
jgi:Cu-Zn family superoxide dismutase